MLWWVVLALACVLLAFLWAAPVQLHAHYRQEAKEALLQVRVRAPLLTVVHDIPISEMFRTAAQHMLARWQTTGEPLKVPLQKTIRRMPRRKLAEVVSDPLRYLGRRTRCPLLQLNGVVGAGDAMESALLSGALWAAVGAGVGWVHTVMHVDTGAARVSIRPDYRMAVWRWHADCIVRFRLGHAIVASVWLLRRAVRQREVWAWVRDTLRRKGEEGCDGASDSGTDEDGDGVN